MDAVAIVAIVFGSLVAVPVGIAIVVAVTVLVLTRRGRDARRNDAQESAMIQELHQGLKAFEQRIGALESLLLERDPPRGERKP